ncbi:MAG: hypothetical protein HOE26_09175, partial [Rhodospirillaceae bacterium]|nr:hypothetical protein [Rhodospirillaceae bacterium]
GLDLAELFITSDARFDDGTPEGTAFSLDDVPGVKVVAAAADGEKCGRCWKVADDIGANSSHPEICGRCGDAVSSQGAE